MFKFEPAERCLHGGISPSVIGHSMRNEFLMNFGSPEIDYRVSVVITERNIQFFYYDGEEEIIDLQNARNMDKLKEVGAISLTNPKETGNDILRFPMIGYGMKFDNDANEAFNGIVESFRQQFYNFPFFKEEDIVFSHFIKCCLLAFVFEFEDREECFSLSPIYDKVRESLRKSDVYNLLSAKIRYALYVPKDGACYNAEEYTYRTRKFADRLMSNRINKVIFYQNYYSKTKKNQRKNANVQGWFYDPEEELEKILDQNRRQESVDNVVLEDNLVLKIRKFLYTKHAVRNAMVNRLGKSMFDCGQWLMVISSSALLVAIILSVCDSSLFDCIVKTWFPCSIALFCVVFPVIYCVHDLRNKRENKVKKMRRCSQIWTIVLLLLLFVAACLSVNIACMPMLLSVGGFCICVVFVVLIFIVASEWYYKREGWANALLPRILVAEMAAWLTIGIGEDLVKSMLWISGWCKLLLAVGIVLVLVFFIVWGEIKQHSPYLRWWGIFKRDIQIINHSLFFALCLGIIMQYVFYDNLVKNSDVISSVVYSDYFDDANYYCQNLEELSQIAEQHINHCNQSDLKDFSMYGEGKDTQIHRINDSIEVLTTIRTNNKTDNNSEESLKEYKDIVGRFNKIVREITHLYTCESVDTSVFSRLDEIPLGNCNDSIYVNTRDANNKKIEGSLSLLQEEISNVRRNLSKFNNYDTLMEWSTVGYIANNIETGSPYLDTLTSKAIKSHVCSRKIEIYKVGEVRIFPYLLIFHTLIVLVIAFVLQLLITDKTVTEPL